MSRQPVTKSYNVSGNKYIEAERKELSDRNASEGIEPRNEIYYDGRLSRNTGMQQHAVRQGKNSSHHRGLSPQYDNKWNYQELGRSVILDIKS